jgi:RND family efflux transporter MFP subunit
MMMWLVGAFHRKIDPTAAAHEPSARSVERSVGGTPLVEVRVIRVPQTESAVGTIRAVYETGVASRLLARVVDVHVTAGQRVTKGDALVRLDDDALKARVEQGEAAVASARAARDQAQIEFDRVGRLVEQQSASEIERDRVVSALKIAEAELLRAEQILSEARTILTYAAVQSPLDGMVIDKRVEIGDMVTPGQVLVSLYDPSKMQLVAGVRESLTHRLRVGQTVDVEIDAIQKRCQGTVSEIVPQAETASRTFAVKVTGPCPPGIYTGMFARLLIPLGEREVLVVPGSAIRRVGQLDVVDVVTGKNGDKLQRRIVQLGRSFGDDVQVLAGLRVGEKVAVGASVGSQGDP